MRLVRIVLFISAAGALPAQHSYTPADLENGGKLFRANCVACHGPEGDMVEGTDLGHGKFRRASSESALIVIIEKGIEGTAMPPHNFSDFEAGSIVAYLHSMATSVGSTSGKGDAVRGRILFEAKGGCTGCHRVHGNGSRTGPDLSEIGTRRRAVELERSLLDPSEEVLPQNRFYRVITRDGETITGRLLNQDSFTVQLLDSKERLLSLSRSSLREAGFLNDSPMPSFREKLTAGELDDLVAYLVSLKGVVPRP
jgi:putative heme-binding domain-containing protein